MWGISFKKLSFLIVLISSVIFSQGWFEYDYARFYNPSDGSSYVELYYSFDRSSLETVTIDGKQIDQGKLGVKIVDLTSDQVVFENTWALNIEETPLDENKLLVGLLDFPLEPSNYRFTVTAEDLNNPEFMETSSFDLSLFPFSSSNVVVSDIQLATGIIPQSQNEESIFYKNSIEVTPNPSLIYGDYNPVLFFYSEIYGLSNENEYVIEQKLLDVNNKSIYDKQRTISGENSSVVEIGALKVNKYNSGIYTLIVNIRDAGNTISINSAKKVYIYNREFIDASTDFVAASTSPLESELMMMSEDEIDYMFETAAYIASEHEKTQWNKLKDYDAKKSFLLEFWNRRDNDGNPAINLFKRDYYDRVAYANKNYGNLSRKEGWKSDRGRVYITYGEPGEIERFQNEAYTKPYEIWQYYDLEGGVIFLFVDEQSMNIYRLIHSTKKGEIYNYSNYQKYVQ